MKRKIISIMAILSLVISMNTGLVLANSENTKNYSESNLNDILLNSGMPQNLLDTLDNDQKTFIIENSGENLEFVAYSTDELATNPVTGEIEKVSEIKEVQPHYIPSTELKLTMLNFNIESNGIPLVEVYSNFEWLRNPKISPDGIYKDHIGIAVPEGWEIQSNKYAGTAQVYDYSLANGWHWSSPKSSWVGNNGNPSHFGGLYGAAWEFNSDAGFPGLKYKGMVKLSMKKKDNKALHRAVSYYNEAKNDWTSSYSVSLQFGPASISFTPNKGSLETREQDHDW